MGNYNINSDNSIVSSPDVRYSSHELLSMFQKFISEENFLVISSEKISPFVQFKLKNNDGLIITINVIIKNITGAGWTHKPKHKRIQVSNLADMLSNNSRDIYLLLGYYNFDDNPLIVAWNPYEYSNHNTVRSCYILTDTMRLGYQHNYYSGNVSSQKVWVITPGNFNKFLQDYNYYVKETNSNDR